MKTTLKILLLLSLTLAICLPALAKDDTEKPHPFKDAVRAFEVEPNDDCATATPLTVGDPMQAAISPETDHDWYAFEAYAGQCLVFETAPGPNQVGGDTRMWLWFDDCATQAGFNDDGGDGLYSRLEYTVTTGGTYYVEVDEYNNDAVIDAYVLTASECPPPPEQDGSICDFLDVCYDWDFAQGDWGFTPIECDAGAMDWQFGTTTWVPGAPGTVWGTVLNGNYTAGSASSLLSPPFEVVAGQCDYMEIRHYFHAEQYTETSTIYDGGNVTVNGIVIPPAEGYDGVAGTAPFCVAGEEVYAGKSSNGPSRTWESRSCFDLTSFAGETIQVSFDFGSDGSVQYPGWYLAYVKIGTTQEPVADESRTWGGVKALYR